MNDSSVLSVGNSLTSSHFNYDYDYLINCTDIIKTCEEALLESDYSVPSVSSNGSSDKPSSSSSDASHESPTSDCPSSGPSSLSSLPSHTSATADTDLTSSCSLFDFNQWLTFTEKRLDDVCFCQQSPDVYRRQKTLQSEIQLVGNRYISGIRHLVNANTSKSKSKALVKLENKWHTLWVRSLEYLMLIEQLRCPHHSGALREKSDVKPETKDNSTNSSLTSDRTSETLGSSPKVLATSDYFSPTIAGTFLSPSSASTPNPKAKSKTVASLVEQFNDFTHRSNNLMRNRRIQNMYRTTCTDTICTPTHGDGKFLNNENIQKDIGYSSDADTSDANCDAINTNGINGCTNVTTASSSSLSINLTESNATTATTAANNTASPMSMSRSFNCQSSDQSSHLTSNKKRQVKRRFRSKLTASTSCGALSSCTKPRPWSFHAGEWTDWDYYEPPLAILSTPSPTEPLSIASIVAPFANSTCSSISPSSPSPAPPASPIDNGAAVPSTPASIIRPMVTTETQTCESLFDDIHVLEKVTEEDDEIPDKHHSGKTTYVLFVTLSFFSFLASIIFASDRSGHLELVYPSSSPPI